MNKAATSSGYKSRITRRILLQYFIAFVGFVIVFLLLAFFASRVISDRIWQPDDPLYIIFCLIRDYAPVFLVIPIILGWMLITYLFMRRPLRYLDEIITASKKLANPTDEQILLPDVMKSVQDELNQVRETSIRNAQLAKEAEQRKNDLIVYLAHDLKTPLTSVIGYLTLLRDEEQISEELREKYLSISLAKAERLEELINEFFEITRFNLSALELQYSKVNLTRMLEQLLFEFKPMMLEKGLRCRLNALPDITIPCDVDKIQRVFDNLLRNAVFYSFENSDITVCVEQDSYSTVITFANQGHTIPKEKLSRLFEQFYRLDVSRSTNTGGAGLGLAIAKQIVEAHNGTITAKSENNQIEFTVTLPLS